MNDDALKEVLKLGYIKKIDRKGGVYVPVDKKVVNKAFHLKNNWIVNLLEG